MNQKKIAEMKQWYKDQSTNMFDKDGKYKALHQCADEISISCICSRLANKYGTQNIPVVDARQSLDKVFHFKTHKGISLVSKGSYFLGYGDTERFTSMTSITGYSLIDTDEKWTKILGDALNAFDRLEEKWQESSIKQGSFDGGGCTYKPAFIEINNFGCGVYGFRSMCIIN